MVFSATFNNISVISWRQVWSVYRKPDYLEKKTTDLLQYDHDHDGPLSVVNIGIFQNEKV